MTRGTGRTIPCDRVYATARFQKAQAFALAKRSASSDHKKAVALLSQTPGKGQDAGHHLRMLLSVKYKVQYDNRNPTISETKRALRSMRSLLESLRALARDKRRLLALALT